MYLDGVFQANVNLYVSGARQAQVVVWSKTGLSSGQHTIRIVNKSKDPKRQAQATLVALIAYSQYFWDHYSGARTLLTEEEFPSDRRRNIFRFGAFGLAVADAAGARHKNHAGRGYR